MRVWKVVVLLNLAIVLTAACGWVWWGRRAVALGRELDATRAQVERLERELAAARSGSATQPGEEQWDVKGVVRAVLSDLGVIVISHEDIPGYMRSMTMGFRTASPKIHESVRVGDAVRFTLRGTPPNVVVTAIQKSPAGDGR